VVVSGYHRQEYAARLVGTKIRADGLKGYRTLAVSPGGSAKEIPYDYPEVTDHGVGSSPDGWNCCLFA
jgi:hypothetical protein